MIPDVAISLREMKAAVRGTIMLQLGRRRGELRVLECCAGSDPGTQTLGRRRGELRVLEC